MVEAVKVKDEKNGTKEYDETGDVDKIDFDSFLVNAGSFGRYQWFLFFSTFPFYIFGSFTYFGQIFLTEKSPNHWCWIPELENLTVIERRTLAIPPDADAHFGYSQCTSYVADWTEVLTTGQIPNASWPVVPCRNGWEFNKTEIPYPTISSELGWVCDKSSYQASAQSFFFVGSIVGGFIIGWISDRFGRLPALTCANVVACIAGICSTFTTNFLGFAICRFFVGMGYDNCMMMVYLILLEYVAPKYRTIIANLPLALFFTLGLIVLPWISLACAHWKMVGLATSVPLGLSLLAPFILPESARWLLSKGRLDETIDKVLMIARVNKKVIPSNIVEQFRISSTKSLNAKSVSLIHIFKRPLVARMFITACALYMCVMIVFDVSARSVGYLEFDFFLSFTLVSLTEFPSILIVSFILDLIGRRWLAIIAMTFSFTFCFMTAFITGQVGSVLSAVIARFFINMAANTAMQWVPEMLPTPVRGGGTSIVHICGYIATVISPFIAYLGDIKSWLPMTIAGVLGIITVFLAFALPETAKKDLPHSFEDTETNIKNQPFWDLPCARKTNQTARGQVNMSFEMN